MPKLVAAIYRRLLKEDASWECLPQNSKIWGSWNCGFAQQNSKDLLQQKTDLVFDIMPLKQPGWLPESSSFELLKVPVKQGRRSLPRACQPTGSREPEAVLPAWSHLTWRGAPAPSLMPQATCSLSSQPPAYVPVTAAETSTSQKLT